MKRKLQVGVIFGGRSGEHEVSLVSAKSVMNAIDKDKYEVVPIGITKEGRWLTEGDSLKLLLSGETAAIESGDHRYPASVIRLEESIGYPKREVRDLVSTRRRELVPGTGKRGIPQVDVVFPVLHGPYGEDGTIQGLLELADIPYVGAGVLGSALGMDKALMKTVFKAKGLPVVDHLVIKRRDWETNSQEVIQRIEKALRYPCFVKPANLGSSVGISKVHGPAELPTALNLAARYDRKILAEQAVDAREIECSVLGNDDPIASVPGEIIPCNEFYDYEAKYIADESDLIIPADLPPAVTQQVKHLAIEAFLALDCAGMARVDLFIDKKTAQIYINELNTIPGFTPISMYPKLWEASGIPYPELIDRLIELALERYEDKSRSETSYDAVG